MIVSALGILALAALLGWTLGGIVLRLAGLTLVLAGLLGVAMLGNPSAVLVLAAGAVLWLGGHWHYALRHQEYKSPLARHLFCRWLPARLDPTRCWTSAVVDERPGREAGDEGRGVR